jgi:hypothetical protein
MQPNKPRSKHSAQNFPSQPAAANGRTACNGMLRKQVGHETQNPKKRETENMHAARWTSLVAKPVVSAVITGVLMQQNETSTNLGQSRPGII